MPIQPGAYEIREHGTVSGTGVGPSRLKGGESLQPRFARAIELLRPPKFYADFLRSAGSFLHEYRDAEAKRADQELDNMIERARMKFAHHQKQVFHALRTEGVGTIGKGSYADFEKEYHKRVGKEWDALKKAIPKVTMRNGEDSHDRFVTKTMPDVLSGQLSATLEGDKLLRETTIAVTDAVREGAVDQARNLGLPTVGRNPSDRLHAFGGLLAFDERVDRMVSLRYLTPLQGREWKEKARQQAVSARAVALVREDPVRAARILGVPRDQQENVLAPEDQWVRELDEQQYTRLYSTAMAAVAKLDRQALDAERQRDEKLKADAEAHLGALLNDGAIDAARTALRVFNIDSKSLTGDLFVKWDRIIKTFEEGQKQNPVNDPREMLPMLLEPEKVDLGALAAGVERNRFSLDFAKEIIRTQRSWREKMADAGTRELITESREVLNKAFGWTPFMDWKDDPRRLSHFAAVREFNDTLDRIDLRALPYPERAKIVHNLRDDIIRRHTGSMKIKVEDQQQAMLRSTPGYVEGMTPEQALQAFREVVRRNPGMYTREHQERIENRLRTMPPVVEDDAYTRKQKELEQRRQRDEHERSRPRLDRFREMLPPGYRDLLDQYLGPPSTKPAPPAPETGGRRF